MHLTSKQIELMRVISPAPIDLDEIVEAVRYETTKASLQFSIRALIKHGLVVRSGVEKRRGRQRQVISATEYGKQLAGVKKAQSIPAYISSVEEDELRSAVDSI